MGYPVQKSSTTLPIVFGPVVLSSDHLSPATGLVAGTSLTVTISKNGAAFAAPAGAITEVGNGFYQIAANATDNATLGPIVVHATGTGADPFDDVFSVVNYDPTNAASLGLTNLDSKVSLCLQTSGYTVPPTTAQIATAVLTDTTAGDMNVANSFAAKVLANAAPSAATIVSTLLATAVPIRAQDGNTAPNVGDALLGAWQEGFGKESAANSSYQKFSPADGTTAIRTFVLAQPVNSQSRS